MGNPFVGLKQMPVHDFLRDGKLHYCNQTGVIEGLVITWTSGATWTKVVKPRSAAQLPPLYSNPAPRGPSCRYAIVRGHLLQNAMFRQTIVRAMLKRGIVGGASNCSVDPSRVDITLVGPDSDIDE